MITTFVLSGIYFATDVPLLDEISIGIIVSILASMLFFILTEFVFKDDSVVEEIKGKTEAIKNTTNETNNILKEGTQTINNIDTEVQQIYSAISVSNDIVQQGVCAVKNIDHQDDRDDFWISFLNNAETRLDIIAHTLSPWFKTKYKDSFRRKIIELAKNNHYVRIILLQPQGNNLTYSNVGNVNDYSKKICDSIEQLQKLYNEIPIEKRQFLNIKLNGTYVIPYSYIKNDKQTLISPYLFDGSERSSFIISFGANKTFANNFDDDFQKLFSQKCLISLKSAVLLETYTSQDNRYSASNWEYEDTFKHIFSVKNGLLEAGYFVHYDKHKNIVDKTIELSSSIGCPFKCCYCASALIDGFHLIEKDEILDVLSIIFQIHSLSKDDNIHITFTGTGDFYWTHSRVIPIIEDINREYSRCCFTISSCAWTKKLITEIENLNIADKIKNLQFTYLSDDSEIVSKLIPNHSLDYDITKILQHISESSLKDKFRINYLMIKDVNDSNQHFENFVNTFKQIKECIVVRISKLNETHCSQMNNLLPPSDEALSSFKEMCINNKFKAYIFSSEKNDNMNCGQLITENKYLEEN